MLDSHLFSYRASFLTEKGFCLKLKPERVPPPIVLYTHRKLLLELHLQCEDQGISPSPSLLLHKRAGKSPFHDPPPRHHGGGTRGGVSGGGGVCLSINGKGRGKALPGQPNYCLCVLQLLVQNDLMRGTKPTSGFQLASDMGPR